MYNTAAMNPSVQISDTCCTAPRRRQGGDLTSGRKKKIITSRHARDEARGDRDNSPRRAPYARTMAAAPHGVERPARATGATEGV